MNKREVVELFYQLEKTYWAQKKISFEFDGKMWSRNYSLSFSNSWKNKFWEVWYKSSDGVVVSRTYPHHVHQRAASYNLERVA